MRDGSPRPAEEFLVLADDILVRQCDVDDYRSHGPGGQKRNKTSSAVRLRHRPTGLIVTAVEDRSQHVNKARAVRRLREAIALHCRGPIDPARYVRSELLTECVAANGQLHVGRRDRRYLSVAGEMLDVLAASEASVSRTAKLLGVSTGQLVKFIKNNPKLWARTNQMRAAAGVKSLR